jgi:glycosyltransferase involved in cell wall biosynthesis
MNKWRIAIDARSAHRRGDGVASYSIGIINALRKYEDLYDFVFVIELGGPIGHICFPSNSEFYTTKTRKNSRFIRDFWENSVLPMKISKMGVHLYHGLDYSIPLIKTPFLKVSTMHDMAVFTSYDGRPWISKTRIRLLLSGIGRRADAIVADSKFSKTEIIRYLNISSDKIKVVWSGIDDSFFDPCDEQIKNEINMTLKESESFILYYGGFRKNKNVEVLLKAWSLIAQRTRTKLVLVGRINAYVNTLDKLIQRLRLQERVVFFGFASMKELRDLLHRCELFVFPSKMEGFGLPVAEAMACGAPVVCSNAASIPEIAGEAAYYFEPNDPEGCASRILDVLNNNKLRLELKEKSKQRASLFRWDQPARSLINIYTLERRFDNSHKT